jgi:hypothetical protein
MFHSEKKLCGRLSVSIAKKGTPHKEIAFFSLQLGTRAAVLFFGVVFGFQKP